MTKRAVNYPHRIGYRLDDEAWDKLEEAILGTGLSPHDWCRLAVMEKLDRDHRLSESERFLFEQFARAQYLVTQGFQLLAEDKLTGAEWMRYRRFADERASEIVDRALASYAKRKGQSH